MLGLKATTRSVTAVVLRYMNGTHRTLHDSLKIK